MLVCFGFLWHYCLIVFHLDVVAFGQDQHVGPSDRFVDDSSLMCKPAAIVSMISVKHIVIY